MEDKPKIAVSQALRDIRSGMDDSALMAKYRVSAKGLQSLFHKLVEKGFIAAAEIEQRTPAAGSSASIADQSKQQERKGALINPADAVSDIRGGMHDFDLMEKYHLSSKGLQSLFDHLVKAGLMDQSEFNRRMPSFDQTVEIGSKGQLLKFGADASSKDEEQELDLTWECPVCGIYQTRSYDKCPECGALVALLRSKPEG